MQGTQKRHDLALFYEALELAAVSGRIPEELLERVEISVEAPSVAVRDSEKEVKVQEILFNKKILSAQTWSAKQNLDYETEQSNIDDHGDRRDDDPAFGAGLIPKLPDDDDA